MLKILDEKKKRSEESVVDEYKNCKYILLDYGDIQKPYGFLYCVSDSSDSFREICEKAEEFEEKKIPCILGGSYNNGGTFGVQYEIA
ncbi:MAG: hypothetical protein IJU50_06975 [Lachnospiraceae bacterium]|nr:hypothetical protein [Lachnospiraceae bacterium]